MFGGASRLIVERERQLTALLALYADAAGGAGRVALVDGGVASGKSELVNALAGHAARTDALVLTASGSVAESEIPLGIIGQLCHSARAQGRMGARLPDAGASRPGPDTRPLGPDTAQLLDDVCSTLLDLAPDRPVVFVVDDVQFADLLSAQALLYLQRRIRTARVLLVLSGCIGARPAAAAFRAELTRQSHCVHLRLLPLSEAGIGALLSARLTPEVAARLTTPVHRLSGGSPVLAHALADDFLAAQEEPAEPAELVVGDEFRQTALACLHRSDPRLLDVARALAVLGPDAPRETVAALAGGQAGQALDALDAAGLVDGGAFRHPAVRAAVLADCPPDRHLELRRRAARLLHTAVAPAADIAEQLVESGEPAPLWAVPVLVAAAQTGPPARAVDHLTLALASTDDPGRRAAIQAALVRAHWRDNPAGALRYLTPLLAAARAGHLQAADTLLLARTLAWHGRTEEAAGAFACVGDPGPDPELADDLRLTGDWLRVCDPAVADAAPAGGDRPEQVLQRARVDRSVLVEVWRALRVLIETDRLDLAADWADRLRQEAAARGVPVWQAVLADVCAAIALRRGDLAAAEKNATTALALLPAPGWGVAVGSPFAHLVRAYTLSGQPAKAEETLWLPTPPAMRHSVFWPRYLRARGAYYEAVDRQHAALADYTAVGEHAARWPDDRTATWPWRVDLARVHARMGRHDRARDLVTEHLALPGAVAPRTKGMALRVLASVCPLRQRQAILREAMDLLHASGDRHELAHAFADLSETGQALGEFGRAKMMGRRAMQLAKRCHAEPLRRKLGDGTEQHAEQDAEQHADGEPRPSAVATLSDAERRVVDLAARGHTNREIGHKLFITVSTVEQHLTRAYRKLNVSRRTDLVPVGPPEEAYA